MQRGGQTSILAIAAATEIGLDTANDAQGPKRRFRLLPMGKIELRDGRGPFLLNDRAHAEEVLAATRAWLGGADFMLDYDHQAVFGAQPGVGGTAIAAGWVKPDKLTAEDDGIWANDVDWTEAAAAKLTAREYRYTSPTFLADRATSRVLRLKNAAIVNIPAIDLDAIAAASLTGDVQTMTLKAIAEATGLGADATEEQILAAIGNLKKPSTSAIAIAAGLAETATVEEVTAAVVGLKKGAAPDPSKYVPIEQVQPLTVQLGVLTAERAEREVAAAVTSGKLMPAMKQWGLDLFKSDEAAWQKFVDGAPIVVAAGSELKGQQKPGGKRTSLTTDEIAACEMTGTSHEDYLASLNEEVA